MLHTIEEAITDLQAGKMIIVVDDENRENEGDLVVLSEFATPEAVNFMITHGKGLVCTSIEEELAQKIGLSMMVHKNTDPFSTAFTVSIDHLDTKTGISAVERSKTIQSLTKRNISYKDFKQPGHVFPLIAKSGGVLTRRGHTEASIDLARYAGSFPSATICEIIKADGTMARLPDLMKMADMYHLKIITIEQLEKYIKTTNEKHVCKS